MRPYPVKLIWYPCMSYIINVRNIDGLGLIYDPFSALVTFVAPELPPSE